MPAEAVPRYGVPAEGKFLRTIQPAADEADLHDLLLGDGDQQR